MPATTVSVLLHRVVWEDGDAQKKADAWTRKLGNSSSQAAIFRKHFLDAGKALYTFVIDSVKNFAQFEDTLSHARRTMGLSREETLALGDSLMDLSTSFEAGGLAAGVSADELAKISGILGQLGFSARDNVEQFQSLVAVVAKVGVAFGMSSEKAAEGLGILKNLYDLPVEHIEKAASSIAYLANNTVATSEAIISIMTRMGGIAGLLGVTAQEAAALGATLRESGVRAQVAGTAMSQIFSRLASDVDRFGEVLKMTEFEKHMLRWNIESDHATDALKMVLEKLQQIGSFSKIEATQALKDLGLSGVRVQQALLALSNNLGGLNTNIAKSNKAFRENVAVNDAYQAAIDNTNQKWIQFKNLIDIIQKMIGKDLALAFSDFLEKHLIPFTDKFKEWLKTSEGAKAIFGREGLIASGLDWIGEKLTNNQEAFFAWADVIDKHIAQFIQFVKNEFKRFFEWLKSDIPEVVDAWNRVVQALQDVEASIKAIKDAWQDLKDFYNQLKEIDEKLGRFYSKIGSFWQDLTKDSASAKMSFDEFAKSIRDAEKAGEKLGDTMVYHSVLPDIQTELDKATAKLEKFGGSTKDLYQTGENTWTNLKREVDETMTAWELQDGYAMNRQKDLQFNLYETADKVANLGYAYQRTGQEAERAADSIQQTVVAAEKLQAVAGGTSPRPAKNMTAEQWQSLSPETIQSLWNTTGLFNASGLLGVGEYQQSRAFEERFGNEGVSQAARETQSQTPINVTLQMGDQEIGRIHTILKDRDLQEQRRSLGSQSKTAG